MQRNRSRSAAGKSGDCCPHCGSMAVGARERVVKRGAVVVADDPLVVTWNGRPVPLSPTEAEVYSLLCRRGRVTVAEIDEAISNFGANPATRSLVLGHIRAKFIKMGACDPFERIGSTGFRLRVDADDSGVEGLVIGLEMPRYATVSR